MTWVLLPVKDLVKAKSRLSGVLAPHERRALAQAMVEDVLSALAAVSELDGVLLISDDPAADLLAHKYAIEAVTEESLGCSDLNSAVEAGMVVLEQRGIEDVLILHSDIPLLQPAHIKELLQDYRQSGADVLLVPDLAGGGSNLMLCKTTRPPEFCYGPGSCAAHRASARERSLQLLLVEHASIGLDVDEPDDLLRLYRVLRSQGAGGHTARLLLDTGIAQRLEILGDNLLTEPARGRHDAV